MAKITAEQLDIAKGWQEFGERLGWTMVSCSLVNGVFRTRAGDTTNIMAETRADIERSWRELEASLDERIIQYEKRSGTDG